MTSCPVANQDQKQLQPGGLQNRPEKNAASRVDNRKKQVLNMAKKEEFVDLSHRILTVTA
jgi:coenzyme F420-reducing hydrogenase alpha subunit